MKLRLMCESETMKSDSGGLPIPPIMREKIHRTKQNATVFSSLTDDAARIRDHLLALVVQCHCQRSADRVGQSHISGHPKMLRIKRDAAEKIPPKAKSANP